MTLVERYIFGSALSVFIAAVGGLTGVIWITQALRQFDLLTTKGQSFWIFLAVTGLTIPSLIMLIAPISLFISVLYTLNKLNGDSELIVMCAAGTSPGRLLRPYAVLTVLVTLLDAYIAIYAMPWSFNELRDLITQVRADFITRIVNPGQFTTLDQGFMFHYRERGPNGELLGIFMQDRRQPLKVMTYVAEVGQTIERDDQNLLMLQRGNVQRQTADSHDAAIIVFERYAIDLVQFAPSSGSAPVLKPRERSTRDLLFRDTRDPYVQRNEGRFRSELHDRFAGPLFTLVGAVIGFVALGQAKTTRQGRGKATFAAVLAFGLLRLGGIGASTMAVRHVSGVVLDYAIPLVSVAVGLAMIFGLKMPVLKWPRVPVRVAAT